MKTPGWLLSSWAKVLGALGVYGTMAGLGLLPLPTAAAATVIGIVTNNVVPALALALVISLATNVIQFGIVRRRYRPRYRRPPLALAVPDDLGSLTLTSEILEGWWNYAMSLVRERVGPDINAYVASVDLYPVTVLSIGGESRAAMKKFDLRVAGTSPDQVYWGRIYKTEKLRNRHPEPLWRTDDTWRELVRAAWLRERPTIHGSVTLYQRDQGSRGWELVFTQYLADEEVMMPGRFYSLEDGELRLKRVS